MSIMNLKLTFFITIVSMVGMMQAQSTVFFENFEGLKSGKNITELQKKKFQSWGKAVWTVSESEGQGFDQSNKFVSSGVEENTTLVKFKNLEAGVSYVFSVAVKVTDFDGKPQNGNYNVKVTSGKKDDRHKYGKEDIKNPAADKWEKHVIKFTVKEGREKVVFQVYRWAKDTTIHVDDFKLVKE